MKCKQHRPPSITPRKLPHHAIISREIIENMNRINSIILPTYQTSCFLPATLLAGWIFPLKSIVGVKCRTAPKPAGRKEILLGTRWCQFLDSWRREARDFMKPLAGINTLIRWHGEWHSLSSNSGEADCRYADATPEIDMASLRRPGWTNATKVKLSIPL